MSTLINITNFLLTGRSTVCPLSTRAVEKQMCTERRGSAPETAHGVWKLLKDLLLLCRSQRLPHGLLRHRHRPPGRPVALHLAYGARQREPHGPRARLLVVVHGGDEVVHCPRCRTLERQSVALEQRAHAVGGAGRRNPERCGEPGLAGP